MLDRRPSKNLVVRAHEAVLETWGDRGRASQLPARVASDPSHTPETPDGLVEEFIEDRRRFIAGKPRFEIIVKHEKDGLAAITVADWRELETYDVHVERDENVKVSTPPSAPPEVEGFVRSEFD